MDSRKGGNEKGFSFQRYLSLLGAQVRLRERVQLATLNNCSPQDLTALN